MLLKQECNMHGGQRLCLTPETCLPAALMLSRKMNTWLSSALNFWMARSLHTRFFVTTCQSYVLDVCSQCWEAIHCLHMQQHGWCPHLPQSAPEAPQERSAPFSHQKAAQQG